MGSVFDFCLSFDMLLGYGVKLVVVQLDVLCEDILRGIIRESRKAEGCLAVRVDREFKRTFVDGGAGWAV